MTNNDEAFIHFMTQGSTNSNLDNAFRLFLKLTFGEEFYKGIMSECSDPFLLAPGQPAISFKEQGFDFVLSQIIGSGWQLTLRHKGKSYITNTVEVPYDSQPGDMVLTFHGIKAEMVLEAQELLSQKQFEEDLRAQRNVEISQDPALLLPNTLLTLADWECQLILEFVRSGCEPKAAISKAKTLIAIQLNTPGAEPGDLSLLDRK